MTILQIDLPVCTLRFSQGACTAPAGSSCYNTWSTCQSPQDFADGTQVLTITDSPTPAANRGYLLALEHTSQQLRPDQVSDETDQVGVVIQDSPAIVDLDDLYNRPGQGTWLARLLARHPYLDRRKCRIIQQGRTSHWLLGSVGLSGRGRGQMQLTSPMTALLKRYLPERTAAPTLTFNIPAAAPNVDTITNPYFNNFEAGTWLVIDDEILRVENGTDGVANRGQLDTAKEAHAHGTKVQEAWIQFGEQYAHIPTIMYQAIVDAGFGEYAQLSDFTAFETGALAQNLDNFIVAEPTEVSDILAQLAVLSGLTLVWDSTDSRIKPVDLGAFGSQPIALTDDDIAADANQPSAVRRSDLAVSRVTVNWGGKSPTDTDPQQAAIAVNLDAESDRYLGGIEPLEFDLTTVEQRDTAAATLANAAAQRILARNFTPHGEPVDIKFRARRSDSLKPGVQIDLTTAAIQNAAGEPSTIRAAIISERIDFYGDLSDFEAISYHQAPQTLNLQLTGNAENYDLFIIAGSPIAPTMLTLTIAAGVLVTSADSTQAAFTAVGFHPDSEITIELAATARIVGGSGSGGPAGSTGEFGPAPDGQAGGDAVLAGAGTFTFTGSGQIAGGGGGGSAGVESGDPSGLDFGAGGAGAGSQSGGAILESPTSTTYGATGGALGEQGGSKDGGTGGAAGAAVKCQGTAGVSVAATIDQRGETTC